MTGGRQAAGFSLMELLIVIAVIGALISAALPNFITYRARAMRTEAISHLAALAAAQTAHLGDFGTYTDNLTRCAFAVDGVPVYLYGFTSDAVPAASATNDTGELRAAGAGSFSGEKMVDAFGVLLSESDLPVAVVSPHDFVVGAVGNIDLDGTLDRWTIDKAGRLVNVVDDLVVP